MWEAVPFNADGTGRDPLRRVAFFGKGNDHLTSQGDK
jgi:hypothetical protein